MPNRLRSRLLALALAACGFACAILLSGPAGATQRTHPCPATGSARGACKGYVVDHVVPLCAGGADAPGNMQWQDTASAKAKDRTERAQCRR